VQLGVPGGVCVPQSVTLVLAWLEVKASVHWPPTVKLPLVAPLMVNDADGLGGETDGEAETVKLTPLDETLENSTDSLQEPTVLASNVPDNVQLPFASVVPAFGVQLGVPGGVWVPQSVKLVFGMFVPSASVQLWPTVNDPLVPPLILSVADGVVLSAKVMPAAIAA